MIGKTNAPASSGPLTPADFRLMAEFRHQLRIFVVFSESAARTVGLAPQQHQALLAIKGFAGNGAPTVGDLADRLAIQHHSAVGLADRLVEARLLVRYIDSTDRRKTTLVLTKRAEKLLVALSAAHREELRRIGPLLRNVLARLEH